MSRAITTAGTLNDESVQEHPQPPKCGLTLRDCPARAGPPIRYTGSACFASVPRGVEDCRALPPGLCHPNGVAGEEALAMATAHGEDENVTLCSFHAAGHWRAAIEQRGQHEPSRSCMQQRRMDS